MHTLYLVAAGDDKRVAYSFLLADDAGVVIDHDVFLAGGERKDDESFCGHIALQRALRRAAKHTGVRTLHIAIDAELADPLAYEVMGINPSLYPALSKATTRIIGRFSNHTLGVIVPDGIESAEEAAVYDNALEKLEESRSFIGRVKVWRDSFLRPNTVIRG